MSDFRGPGLGLAEEQLVDDCFAVDGAVDGLAYLQVTQDRVGEIRVAVVAPPACCG